MLTGRRPHRCNNAGQDLFGFLLEHVIVLFDVVQFVLHQLQVIGALLLNDKVRFMDLMRTVDGIGAKMLSKELQELEINQLITRTVCDTKPITVEYQITEYGKTLKSVIHEMELWGTKHRQRLFAADKTDQ